MRMDSVSHGVYGMYAEDGLWFENYLRRGSDHGLCLGRCRRRKDDDREMEYVGCKLAYLPDYHERVTCRAVL